ncbi:MAG: amidohydrolase family protein [Phycisphaeraceae bacterium]|nr:amidohydrolase family protein [Phycisphaeraceae bacterium]MBX3406964.1 amidohydrolase family protein [Phycisphaeraceae bacterium]
MNTLTSGVLDIRRIGRAACMFAACVGMLAAGRAAAQDLGRKAPAQAEAVVIHGATVHTVSGQTLTNSWVYFREGKVVGLGPGPMPRFASPPRMIDGTGKHVYPGLVTPYSQLGLTEIQAVRATLDISESGQATPEVRAVVAVNPDSTLIPVTRSNGVLIAGVFPQVSLGGLSSFFEGPGGLMPGRAGVIRLEGWTYEDMAVMEDAGLVVNWPQSRPISAPWMDRSDDEQTGDADRALRTLDALFTGARSYAAARAADASLPTDLRFAAMQALFAPGAAQRPVFAVCNDAEQIRSAVSFCQKHGVRCVIVGGRDAEACADLLKRHDIPVIISGGTARFPRRDDMNYDDPYTLPARLEAAGVRWALANGDDTAHERNLPYAAALAVAHGLAPDAAIRGITLSAAQILGIGDRYGSLEAGRSATLFIADGDILEVSTNVEAAFIDGREIDMDDKHKALERKYREKYRQQRDRR